MNMFVTMTLAAGLIASPAFSQPNAYELDKVHSVIEARWDNMGITTPALKFTEYDSEFLLDFENPENSAVDVTIETASLQTGVESLDENLRSQWYFDVETFPQARFVATEFVPLTDRRGVMKGELTLKGATHPVVLDVAMNHAGAHPLQPVRDNLDDLYVAGFSASGVISRSAFGLGLISAIPDGIDLRIELSLEREMTAEEQAELIPGANR